MGCLVDGETSPLDEPVLTASATVAGDSSIYFELTPAMLSTDAGLYVADVELRQGNLVKTVPDDATDSDPEFGFNIIQDVTRQAALTPAGTPAALRDSYIVFADSG